MRPSNLVLALGAVVVVVVAAAFAVWALAHGPVDEPSLARAVERESGSAGVLFDVKLRGCVAVGVGGWECQVLDSGASGTVTYHVLPTDGSCWEGRLTRPAGETMPRTISGCVLLRD